VAISLASSSMTSRSTHLPRSLKLVAALVFVLGAALTLIVYAPAQWTDLLFAKATQGRLRMAEAQGTLWKGSGRVVLADAGFIEGGLAGVPLRGVTIPGRTTWNLNGWRLLVGAIDAELKFESMSRPVRLTGGFDKLRASSGALELPALALDAMGSPWNTIKPSALLSLKWDSIELSRGQFSGKASLDLGQVASALSSVKPLGDYRVEINGLGNRAQLSIKTINGPLVLEGDGEWTSSRGLRFTAFASATEAEKQRLQSMLGLLGRRDGERTVIKIGA
jgi:general secretion pathway protein N